MSETVGDLQAKIAEEVRSNPVMVYMKGTPDAPQCGFSAQVANIFRTLNVPFGAVDVIGQDGYRDGIKKFTNWPTIPQVFVGGKFVGGCDITTELYSSGELQKMVAEAVAQK